MVFSSSPSSFEFVEQLPHHRVVLDHSVGVNAEPGLALRFGLEPRPDVHAGGVPPQEERLALFLRLFHEPHGFAGEFLVHRFHALLVQRAGQLDLLRAIGVGPAVNDATRRIALTELGILEVIRVFRFVLGVEVVQGAEEFVETVRRGQVFVAIAQMVLPELAGLVAPGFQQFRDRHIPGLQSFRGARQTDLEHAGAEANLAGDESRTSGRTTLLAVPVRELRPFIGDTIDVRRLVTHHPLVEGADVPVADVVAPDDEYVRLMAAILRHRRAAKGEHCERQKYCFHDFRSRIADHRRLLSL